MNISVFGLGYVGCVSMGCLAKLGHHVIGVDVSEHKVDLINNGKPTIIENKIDELIEEGVNQGKVKATLSPSDAISETEFSFICVGTPVNSVGKMNLSFVENVAKNIGKALTAKNTFHTVAIRSTVPPGTCELVADIISKESGKVKNEDFAVISNPEFLREGSAVDDYFDPAITVIGSDVSRVADIAQGIYNGLDAPIEIVDVKVAEIIKFVNNSWHATKISFANEIGSVCKAKGIDSHSVMSLFNKDTKLNLGKAYTKPGFSYGGSCLPKDLSGLAHLGKENDLEMPLLTSVSRTNELLKNRALNKVLSKGVKRTAVLGISFKEGTDDLRFSPYVDLIEGMIGKGIKVGIYDKNISYTRLLGINKSYIDEHLPHISDLLCDTLEETISEADIVIISHRNSEFVDLPGSFPDKHFVELTRNQHSKSFSNLEGINW